MPGPVYVVMCGQVREIDIFAAALAQCAEWRKAGMIDGVIVSTWESEAVRVPGLAKTCRQNGFKLVLSHEPALKQPGNYIKQAVQLYCGLEQAPDDAWIFKTRCDNRHENFDLTSLLEADFALDVSDRQRGIFNHRVWVPSFEITHPFFFGDQVIFAARADMIKFCHFDIFYDALDRPSLRNESTDAQIRHHSTCAAPEVCRFLLPFLDFFPLLRDYREVWSLAGFHTPYRHAIKSYNVGQPIYWDHIAMYYSLIRRFFHIGHDISRGFFGFRTSPSGIAGSIDSTVFLKNFVQKETFIFNDNSCDWLNQALTGQHADKTASDLLTAAHKRIEANHYARSETAAFTVYQQGLEKIIGNGLHPRSQNAG